ncbi:MAG: alanine racemase [Pseudomonadota bacterium]
MARAELTVDLGAVARNWRRLDRRAAPGVETAAVVKADAYGLGAARVAPALAEAGARTFFVALAEEGAALRDVLGPGPRIYVFSGPMPGDLPTLRAADLRPLLNSAEQIAALADAPLPCGLQLDTGMNRLGLAPAELAPLAEVIGRLDPDLVISHLASADQPADAMNAAQLGSFRAAAAHPSLAGRRLSLAATGGTLLGPDYHFAMTRPGIGLYGGLPFGEAEAVVALDLPVIQVRDVAQGETVGYGATWRAAKQTRIATLSAGYADGLLRALGGRITLHAGPTPCPSVGRLSMDLLTVDVGHLGEVPPTLSLLGPQQSIDDLADLAGTIGYEVLTMLGTRYGRVYKDAAG